MFIEHLLYLATLKLKGLVNFQNNFRRDILWTKSYFFRRASNWYNWVCLLSADTVDFHSPSIAPPFLQVNRLPTAFMHQQAKYLQRLNPSLAPLDKSSLS